jgi:tRNA pseudouridine55 synthase
MLPLCFGEATKICAYLLEADKTYRVVAKLGESTDTGDADGQITGTGPIPDLDSDGWQQLLNTFLGATEQIPPMYSALKKDGKRLYELARKGEVVERAARPIRIDAISLIEASGSRLAFRVSCAKGTYIRTLVEDIARAAGTVAHTAKLHRETVGDFRAEDMLDMTGAEQAAEEGPSALREQLLPADVALAHWPTCHVADSDQERFSGGQQVACDETGSGLIRVYGAGERFLGVGELMDGGRVAPRRIFMLAE